MRRKGLFFLKALLVLLLTGAFVFGLAAPQYTQGFNASLLDKVERLDGTGERNGGRIVLIGNSNLPFGMDSPRLEAALGMPVVNMGLHGGMGNAFHEAMAKMDVRPGDVYVVCHTEYNAQGDRLDSPLVWITIENHLPLYRLVPRDAWGDMVLSLGSYVKRILPLWAEGTGNADTGDAYSRGAFNAYGDNVIARPQTVEGLDFSAQTEPYIEEACIRRLNALHAYLAERGASMVVAAYPIANGEYTPRVAVYEAFGEELAARLDCDVISFFPEYMLDYSFFYDTLYHLTDEGTQARTDLLIEDLRIWLENAGRI